MSNFSTIFNELVGTTIPGLTGFSGKTEIANPYALELNDFNTLRDGWGIVIGDSSDSEYQEYKFTIIEQEISFVLTRVVRSTRHNVTPLQTALKAMIEDAITMRIDLLNDDQITIPSNIYKIDFLGRTAVEFLDAEEWNIITTTNNFMFSIRETL